MVLNASMAKAIKKFKTTTPGLKAGVTILAARRALSNPSL